MMQTGMSRRNFLQGVGVTAAGIGAAAALTGCTTVEEEVEVPEVEPEVEVVEKEVIVEVEKEVIVEVSTDPITTELEIPKWPTPTTVSYECDVLVAGGGWTGIAAARASIDNGFSVVVVDKGRPGFSGLSAWTNSFCWFDEDYDDANFIKNMYRQAGEYSVNQNWLDVWIAESKAAYTNAETWGVMQQYPNASSADEAYGSNGDPRGYLIDFVTTERDRHWHFRGAIIDYGAELVEQTMITNVIVDGGRVVGAVGFHVPTATVISIACKAVIMCTGPGCYKPCGYPTGSSTWDGDYIGYNLGVPMAGKEFADFHGTSNCDCGSTYTQWIGMYVQSNWLCKEEETPSGWTGLMTVGYYEVFDGTTPWDPNPAEEGSSSSGMSGPPSSSSSSSDEEEEEEVDPDIRVGELTSPFQNLGLGGSRTGVGYPAPGLGIHKGEGAFTGTDATCITDVPGLYYAGDALSSSSIGFTYFGVGFSSCMSVCQGVVAAREAATYVKTAEPGYITAATLEEQTEIILAPLNRGTGFDPCWLRDALQAIMSQPTVAIAKTEATLSAALVLVEQLRDMQLPLMAAVDGHELRLCHEMNAKVLHAEMKLRSGLARKESRGRHYRIDYPYRDDANFLCQVVLSKGSDGNMEVTTVDHPEDWCGDTSMDYLDRYLIRFPGECDALGLTDPGLSSSEMLVIINERSQEAY